MYREISYYLQIDTSSRVRPTIYTYNDSTGKLESGRVKFNKTDWIIYDPVSNHIIKLKDAQFSRLFVHKLTQEDKVSISALATAINKSQNRYSLSQASMW